MWLNWSLALSISAAVGAILLKTIIAVAIYRSAKIRASTIGAPLRFFQPPTWALVGFIGGIFALGLYWIIHYSTLAKEE
jgi:hypothetical protein